MSQYMHNGFLVIPPGKDAQFLFDVFKKHTLPNYLRRPTTTIFPRSHRLEYDFISRRKEEELLRLQKEYRHLSDKEEKKEEQEESKELCYEIPYWWKGKTYRHLHPLGNPNDYAIIPTEDISGTGKKNEVYVNYIPGHIKMNELPAKVNQCLPKKFITDEDPNVDNCHINIYNSPLGDVNDYNYENIKEEDEADKFNINEILKIEDSESYKPGSISPVVQQQPASMTYVTQSKDLPPLEDECDQKLKTSQEPVRDHNDFSFVGIRNPDISVDLDEVFYTSSYEPGRIPPLVKEKPNGYKNRFELCEESSGLQGDGLPEVVASDWCKTEQAPIKKTPTEEIEECKAEIGDEYKNRNLSEKDKQRLQEMAKYKLPSRSRMLKELNRLHPTPPKLNLQTLPMKMFPIAKLSVL